MNNNTQWIEIDSSGKWHKASPPLCTICEKPVKSFDYDPINGGEIQQCDGCAESQNEDASR